MGRPIPRSVRRAGGVLIEAGRQLLADDGLMLAAGVAYYTSLSLAPLLMLLLWVGSLLGPGLQQQLVDQVVGLMGSESGEFVRALVEHLESEGSLANAAGALGLATLVLAATAVFASLQNALNRAWDVVASPRNGLWDWVRKRLLSLGLVAAIGFLLLVSLGVSAALSALGGVARGWLPGAAAVWQVLNVALSYAVVTTLFAAVFKVLPDVHIAWRDTWIGALVTALLFTLGKHVIGLYLGHSSIGSAYGAAGSLVVLLVWVYYSGVLVLYGAEVTKVQAVRYGRGLVPEEHAEWEPGAAPPDAHDGARSSG